MGIVIFGKTSVGMWSTVSPPNSTIRIDMTTKVYGRFRAIRTIWFMRRSAETRRCDLTILHRDRQAAPLFSFGDQGTDLGSTIETILQGAYLKIVFTHDPGGEWPCALLPVEISSRAFERQPVNMQNTQILHFRTERMVQHRTSLNS